MAIEPDPRAPTEVVEEIGDRISDLRSHLCHAHPFERDAVDALDAADLAALHRRAHGRAVEPEPGLVDVCLVEVASDPDARATTTLELADALVEDRPLVWLPLRIADLIHDADAPGHAKKGGCRACADVVDAAIRALQELDTTPATQLADTTAAFGRLLGSFEATLLGLADERRAASPEPEAAG